MADLKRLREQRGEKIAAARALVDQAAEDKRELSSEESAQYDKLIKNQEDLRVNIDREVKLQELERAAATRAAAEDPETRDKPAGQQASKEQRQMQAFNHFLRTGQIGADGAEEFRTLQAGTNPEGGYLIAPQEFVTALLKNIDDLVYIRANATKFPVPIAQSLGVPTLDTDPSDADWTSELATGTEDTAMRFGKRELTPHPLAKRIKISNKLLRQTLLPAEQIVRDRLDYKFDVAQEKAFLTGSGASQPLGIFTAGGPGISTARDVSSGNSSTAIGMDGIISAKYALKGAYWADAVWMFHRDALQQLSKLKDTTNQYLWQPSNLLGQPDRLQGLPLIMSEWVPNTFTTGQYVGALANWRYYWIADALDMQLQRLVELYAETNQVGLIGRLETDGMPVLEEAFVRVKLA